MSPLAPRGVEVVRVHGLRHHDDLGGVHAAGDVLLLKLGIRLQFHQR